MNIFEVDLDELDDLSPQEYIWLMIFYKTKKYQDVNLDKLRLSWKVDVEKLFDNNYLISGNNFDVSLSPKFTNKFCSSPTAFDELLKLYPRKTPSGQRILHPGNMLRARTAYTKLLKSNKALHEEIMTGLKNELANRERHNSLEYMVSLEKWLKDKTWTLYLKEDVKEEVTHKKKDVF